jgi:hypothetical protein
MEEEGRGVERRRRERRRNLEEEDRQAIVVRERECMSIRKS